MLTSSGKAPELYFSGQYGEHTVLTNRICHFDRVAWPMHLGPGHILEGKIETQSATTNIRD